MGEATFKGISGGIYLNADGTKDYITASALSADVDFLNRSIALSTLETTKVATDSTTGLSELDPSLNMTGTLTYEPRM